MSAPDLAVAPPRRSVIGAAWAIVLAVSLLPVVIAQELLGWTVSPDARFALSVVVLGVAAAATLAWDAGRPLRPLLWVLLALTGMQWLAYTRLDTLPPVADLLRDGSFGVALLAEMGLNLVVTLAMVAVLFALHRDRHAFYLAKGELAAPAAPIRWMGVAPGTRWSTLGPILAAAITAGTLAFLVLSGTPSVGDLARVAPLLPVVLLAAALNAFNEEVTYKASLLSVLVGPVGSRDALRMVAAFFGLGHFYGVPYGVIGVILAWFLGWILARSMLETRGLAWAWFIHFLQDVAIFGFLAVGAITPGGA
jgi:hypothetical protein